MEALKKIMVLMTSLIIIGLIVYIVSVSSPSPSSVVEEPLSKPSEEKILQPQSLPEPQPLDDHSHEEETVEAEPPASSTHDAVEWRTAPNVGTDVDSDIAIRGGFPLGNPNSIFVTATKRILPAVVSIQSTRKVRGLPKNFFHRFFRDKKKQEQEQEEKEDQPGEDEFYHPGSGSGILISDRGYILTNYHVVEDAKEIRVTLYDKREFYGQFFGGDPTTDIALIKIDARELPVAFIGNSDSIQIGEWVIAVGNPLNFTSTVTAGIISALGRNINIINENYRIENFIQTDAVINPGNSGGALVNLKGEVIGINTAIATRTGLYQGYGFAIPINLAKRVVNDILAYGHVRRGLLGVNIAPVNDRVARGVGLSRPRGALIQNVQEGYPAKKVGLRQGDIILKVDDEEVVSMTDLQIKIARHHPEDRVKLLIWRDKKKFEVQVTLAEAPVPEVHVEAEVPNNHVRYKNLGMNLREMTPEEKSRYRLDTGLIVEKVVSGSPAEQAGIGDKEVIISVNESPVRNLQEFQRLIQNHKPGEILKLKILSLGREEEIIDRIAFLEVP